MSCEKGIEITCDRCGLKAFVPGDNPAIPQGWIDGNDVKGHLCPDCTFQWGVAKKAFMECEQHTIFPPCKIHKEK